MEIRERVEGYIINLSLTYETVEENTWIINDEDNNLNNLVVVAEEPLVIFRVNVMEIPADKKEEFFEELLRLNASDLVHGAYALENNNVILIDTLEVDTMDLEEFQASLDAIGLALSQHYHILSKYRKQ
mgnify:CR=1 FL=1